MEKEYYEIETQCVNCGNEQTETIEMGTTVYVLKVRVCKNCGCNALKVIN